MTWRAVTIVGLAAAWAALIPGASNAQDLAADQDCPPHVIDYLRADHGLTPATCRDVTFETEHAAGRLSGEAENSSASLQRILIFDDHQALYDSGIISGDFSMPIPDVAYCGRLHFLSLVEKQGAWMMLRMTPDAPLRTGDAGAFLVSIVGEDSNPNDWGDTRHAVVVRDEMNGDCAGPVA